MNLLDFDFSNSNSNSNKTNKKSKIQLQCIRVREEIEIVVLFDFEEIIASPAIFMIISQHFDVEQDKTKGEKGKRGGRIMIDSC